MEVGQLLKLKITSLDVEGKGVSKYKDKTVFVEGALPDEEVEAVITAISRNVIFSKVTKVKNENKDRITPTCPYFEKCGGCDLMHMSYECELKVKEEKVRTTISKIAKLNPIVNRTIAADNIKHYRNKCIVPFQEINEEVVYGFYEKRSHNVIPMQSCEIEPVVVESILQDCKEFFVDAEISIYNEFTHQGIIRNVMIRKTYDDKLMVVIIATKKVGVLKFLAMKLMEKYNVESVYLNINDKQTNVVLADEYVLLGGNSTITENILGLSYNVSPATFLQVNHEQCEKLYNKAIEYANLTGNENVIDAYCGMGSITLNLAKNAKHVYGIEIVPQAIENANINKTLNNIHNVDFICGKCEDEIVKLVNEKQIDLIVFDPPRKGCDVKFLDTVIDMKIPKIVYVSCNVATLARDIKYLNENNYEVIEVTPVDLFPRTSHVETVTLLTQTKK